MVLYRLVATTGSARISTKAFKNVYHDKFRVFSAIDCGNSRFHSMLKKQFPVQIHHANARSFHQTSSASLFRRFGHRFSFAVRAVKRRLSSKVPFATADIVPQQHATAAGRAPNAGFVNEIIVVTEAGINLPAAQRKSIGIWLGMCGMAAAATITIGGMTRLTEAGLSITRWDLVKGVLPPMDPMSWRLEFERYKQYPEYQYKNSEITLEEFKDIYLMEYAHRMAGRLIGVMFFVPAAFMWYKGKFDYLLKRRIVGVGLLLAWQGVLGWLMVRSGLVNHRHDDPNHVPRVSQYRLAAHLASALALTVTFFYMSQNLMKPAVLTRARIMAIKPHYLAKLAQGSRAVHACAGLAFLTAVSGAFVAGLDAGLVYNTFPKFAGQWIPSDLISDRMPFWRNFFENPTTCQFQHRLLGTVTGIAVLTTWWRYNRYMVTSAGKTMMFLAALATAAQIGMGITTLVKNVPVEWAGMHQANNTVLLILLTLVLRELHWIRRAARL